jgi:antitoxin ParD1/3/4
MTVFKYPLLRQYPNHQVQFNLNLNLAFENYQKLVILLKSCIMGRNTSISLGDHFEIFVDKKVSTGRFKNASEVIRAGLRLLEEEEAKVAALQKAIKDGIDSGMAKNFDAKKHLAKLKSVRRRDGK